MEFPSHGVGSMLVVPELGPMISGSQQHKRCCNPCNYYHLTWLEAAIFGNSGGNFELVSGASPPAATTWCMCKGDASSQIEISSSNLLTPGHPMCFGIQMLAGSKPACPIMRQNP